MNDHNHSDPLLTAREEEVLALLRDGLSNKEIGKALGISQDTAQRHVSHVLRKYEVISRTELLARLLKDATKDR